ncbi:TlpA disulfide reductase family protein [Variovorax sp. J22R115]|uniref:TlpA family protein disulfide reductase n=1 Tax=Variovorax sp. J22R115 TaxID=3053509 RepID=UPI002574CC25|nr:TlpA disulfide reductase family protein [Variovorax sp. J22R115]MDM0050267.1 TlpA disulfide reductase family protein [Variovorax sp. J22R115]
MTTRSTRRAWLYASVAGVAALAGAGGAFWRSRAPQGGGGRLDEGFWSQRFERPEGGEVAFNALRGRPLIINFWATWCPPCVEEMPMIDAFFRENAANGWQVVGLAIDQPSAVRKFLAKTPVSYPIGLAGMQGTELVKQLGNTAGGLPFTLFIDGGGSVAARKMGKLDAGDLQSWRRA